MKYGIISDIHSDIISLNKVITKLEKQNADKIFCCGDLVGYGNFPDAVFNDCQRKIIFPHFDEKNNLFFLHI